MHPVDLEGTKKKAKVKGSRTDVYSGTWQEFHVCLEAAFALCASLTLKDHPN